MKINRIVLENVRSHKLSEIVFCDGITVIMGRTGSGKSSILMAVDYALFGSENISNSELLRRGAKFMRISLEFEHNKKSYCIVRGLKKSGDKVLIDFDNLKVLENGKQLNILSRAKDVNELIQRILGYPDNVKMSQMFQVTTYTRQDEIRKLIEMKAEERQEYIDKILQLSKYKNTFDNLKDVIVYFKNKSTDLTRIEEFKTIIEKEIIELKKDYNKKVSEVSENEKEIRDLDKCLEIKKSDCAKLQKESEELEKEISKIKENNSTTKANNEQLERLIEKQKLNSKKIDDLKLKVKPSSLIKSEIEKNIKDNESIVNVSFSKIEELNKEALIIQKKGSKCPLCKQVINELHADSIKKEADSKIRILEKEIKTSKEKLVELYKTLDEIKNNEELNVQIANINGLIKQNDELISELNKKNDGRKIINITIQEEKYEQIKKELKKRSIEEKELFSKLESLKTIKQRIELESKKVNEDIIKKESQSKNYDAELLKKKGVDAALKFLSMLREDIKDIRSTIRQKFLLDFRYEFQQKFAEIRKQEEEYSVEVGNDYEPVAYTTSGDEVPVSHLSGGEKTSVALAYRLALSSLVSQMNNVMPSTLLILDEPTTGFDEEDIKTMPQALENIESISQIIIVTHENTLKDVANCTVEVKKVKNESKLETV